MILNIVCLRSGKNLAIVFLPHLPKKNTQLFLIFMFKVINTCVSKLALVNCSYFKKKLFKACQIFHFVKKMSSVLSILGQEFSSFFKF